MFILSTTHFNQHVEAAFGNDQPEKRTTNLKPTTAIYYYQNVVVLSLLLGNIRSVFINEQLQKLQLQKLLKLKSMLKHVVPSKY